MMGDCGVPQQNASSAETVGEFWFRKTAEVVIQGNFDCCDRAKAVRLFHDQFDFIVESLDDSGGNHTFGTGPVENQLAMFPKRSGNLFHRTDLAFHRSRALSIQKDGRPARALVFPEALEILSRRCKRRRRSAALNGLKVQRSV